MHHLIQCLSCYMLSGHIYLAYWMLTASIKIYGLVHAYQIGTLHPTFKGRKNFAFKTELTV